MADPDGPAVGRHAGDPAPASWWTHLKAVGALAIALAFVVAVPLHWSADRAAARDEGVPGRFRVTDEDVCGRGGCSYLVDFTSDDGSIRLRDHETQDVGDHLGAAGRAQYFPDEDRIYAMGSRSWLWGVALFIAGTGWIVGYGVWLVDELGTRRRLRHARAARARADGVPE